ncbi:MAG: NADP-dependent malic enzyme [Candidatus Aenigmatarchaeota archaeon]
MNIRKEALKLHKKFRGKIEIKNKFPIKNQKDLSLAYTPGVAEVSKEVAKNSSLAYYYTSKWNLVAIVTDGSRVLGLGNIGPLGALPVMEGKALLFKYYANVDAFPICLATQDTEKIVETVKNIAPVFGGINLEDIDAPRCFEVYDGLRDLDIPVFHDDRHGTAVVVLAGLINALKIVKKDFFDARIVIGGAGAAGIGVAELLVYYGFKNLILVDSKGILYEGRKNMDKYKQEISRVTNREKIKGSLEEALKEADVFIGLTGVPNLIKKEMIKSMNKDAIIFALTNPFPEVMPRDAISAGAKIVATGRSDLPNQINNSLAFPGIFRGVLDARARRINEDMQIEAAKAISNMVKEKDLRKGKIVPDMVKKDVAKIVAKAVYRVAKNRG